MPTLTVRDIPHRVYDRLRERAARSADVLKLVERTGHSSYDCEFVAVAEAAGLQLVTGDRAVARLFPNTAVLLEEYAQKA